MGGRVSVSAVDSILAQITSQFLFKWQSRAAFYLFYVFLSGGWRGVIASDLFTIYSAVVPTFLVVISSFCSGFNHKRIHKHKFKKKQKKKTEKMVQIQSWKYKREPSSWSLTSCEIYQLSQHAHPCVRFLVAPCSSFRRTMIKWQHKPQVMAHYACHPNKSFPV